MQARRPKSFRRVAAARFGEQLRIVVRRVSTGLTIIIAVALATAQLAIPSGAPRRRTSITGIMRATRMLGFEGLTLASSAAFCTTSGRPPLNYAPHGAASGSFCAGPSVVQCFRLCFVHPFVFRTVLIRCSARFSLDKRRQGILSFVAQLHILHVSF
jgi:hypothetical protein